MAKHIIFLVHGMGDFKKGWSESVQDQVKSLYSAYKISRDFSFDTFFRFQEITYNHRFDKLREQWKKDSKAVLDKLKEGGIEKSLATDLAKAGGAPGGDGFLSSHVLDVVLYRSIPMVAEAIRNDVSKQIVEALLDPANDERPKWSMIAHSLGTAVAHDSLHALFTGTVDGQTLAGTTKAHVLMMAANVSRLLEQKLVDAYRSVVRPGAQPADGVCRVYLNAKHDWDPIPRPREFRPLDDWPDLPTRQEGRFVPISINAFQSKNVHALSHYLSNPKVHVEFFRRLFPIAGAISDAELAQASALYEAATPFGQFEALQKKLKDFQLHEEASFPEVIKAFQGFFDALKAF